MQTFKLVEATIFTDLNKKEGKDANFARDTLQLNTLKYKHFREVIKKPENEQMHFLMLTLAGLSDEDAGELTPDDAAELYDLVFQAMQKYMQLGQKIMHNLQAS